MEEMRFSGVVEGDENQNLNKKIPRKDEDGILLVVPVRINGNSFSALIDSGASRCCATPECCVVAGMTCFPKDAFLDVGNETKPLFCRIVPGH